MSDEDEGIRKSNKTLRTPLKPSKEQGSSSSTSEESSDGESKQDLISLETDPNFVCKNTKNLVSSDYSLRSKKSTENTQIDALDTSLSNPLKTPLKPLSFGAFNFNDAESSPSKNYTGTPNLNELDQPKPVAFFVKLPKDTPKMSEISADKIFSGLPHLKNDPLSLEMFLGKCDLVFSTLKDPDSITFFLLAVKSNTTGTIKLNIDKLQTWPLIRAQLIASILPTKTVAQLGTELLKLEQGQNQSVQDFADKIVFITNALNIAHSKGEKVSADVTTHINSMTDKAALAQFENGLRSDLKLLVKSRAFTSLASAISYARSEESNVTSFPSSSNHSKNSRNPNKDNKAPLVCYKCGLSGHMANFCKSKPNNQSRQAAKSSDNQRSEKYFCDFCNRPGHSIDRCFEKKRKNSCSYCNSNQHNTQNCMKKIADQPFRQVNHMTSLNDNLLAQLNLPDLIEKLTLKVGNQLLNNQRFNNNFNQNNQFPNNFQGNGQNVNNMNVSNGTEIVRSRGNINHVQSNNSQLNNSNLICFDQTSPQSNTQDFGRDSPNIIDLGATNQVALNHLDGQQNYSQFPQSFSPNSKNF